MKTTEPTAGCGRFRGRVFYKKLIKKLIETLCFLKIAYKIHIILTNYVAILSFMLLIDKKRPSAYKMHSVSLHLSLFFQQQLPIFGQKPQALRQKNK